MCILCEGTAYIKVDVTEYCRLCDKILQGHHFKTISVRSPGLPGQRFMTLEYRVPVYRNQRCSGLTAH